MNEKNNYINIISDIEMSLRNIGINISKVNKNTPPDFIKDIEKNLNSESENENDKLQKYIYELLEKRGPRRPSGKVDTVCFYESCCISATSWSNFNNGRCSKETIKKIVAGLECNLEETKKAFELAGFTLTGSLADRLIIAAIMSGHHNTAEMYEILDFYSEQYKNEVKNYYKTDL